MIRWHRQRIFSSRTWCMTAGCLPCGRLCMLIRLPDRTLQRHFPFHSSCFSEFQLMFILTWFACRFLHSFQKHFSIPFLVKQSDAPPPDGISIDAAPDARAVPARQSIDARSYPSTWTFEFLQWVYGTFCLIIITKSKFIFFCYDVKRTTYTLCSKTDSASGTTGAS